MKVIIAGGRDFNDYQLLYTCCDKILKSETDIEIVSGTARGADKLGERYAQDKNYPVAYFKPDWDNLGKSAGYIRNAEMANYADALIAFHDGVSRGTQHMIDLAKKNNLKIKVIKY